METPRFRPSVGLILAGLLVCATPAAKAALLAYEGFIYTAGDSLTNASAQGSGGSFGWAGRWTGANIPNATNDAASLGYTDAVGNTLVTNGGSVVIGVPGGTTVNSQPSRSLSFGTLSGNTYSGLTGPGTYWASFVMQWIGPVTAGSSTNQYVRKGDLVFRSGAQTNATGTGAALFSVGSPNAGNRIGTPYDTWATWTGNDATAGTPNTGLAASGAPLNVPTFVLLRLDLDGGSGNDTVYSWFNWTNLNSEPPISTAHTTNNSASQDGLNNIRLDANGGNASGTNTVLAFDEFRFGTTFADVTPHSTGSTQIPMITVQPANATVTVSDPAAFSVTAIGDPPLYYQWYFNSNTPVGTDSNVLALASVQVNDAGTYQCIVTNASGSATSSVATLTVLPPIPPGISVQPKNWTNAIGYPATFSVNATGSPPLSYQWYFNTNTPVAGGTNTLLSFIIASSNSAGYYSVVVTNRFGSITSSPAALIIGGLGAAHLPAFPGADGAGKLASGGRGGIVYRVTRLNSQLDDPQRASPGTFLYGLNNGNFPSGVPRTIVFDVAGVFHLGLMDTTNWTSGGNAWDATSRQSIGANNLTIAGQTAPGPVIFMGGTLKPSGSNIVIRNVTIAGGYGMKGFWEPKDASPPSPGTLPTSFTMDAMDISGQNIMIDHIGAYYCTDETVSCNEFADNVTIQYSNCSQSQNHNSHAYAHAFGGGTDKRLSFINNFDAHHFSRLPRTGAEVGTGGFNDFRNNVFYSWKKNNPGYSGADQWSKNNFIQNFYLQSPGGATGGLYEGAGARTPTYLSGNLLDENMDGDPNDTFEANTANNKYRQITLQPAAYDINIGVTLDARQSFTNVLRYAGPRWWERDYDFTLGNTTAINTIEERLIHEAITVTGSIVNWADNPYDNDPNEGVEWRSLWALRADPVTGAAPFTRPANWDTDGDGMPDWWEIEHGLNPAVPNNNEDFDADGYTDLEEYMNEIAAWPAPGVINFTGEDSDRFARIFNWRVNGRQVNITNLGNVVTYSYWQPSRYDTALISNRTCVVDAVGQHAGILRLTNNAMLKITNGWLSVADKLEIGAGCTASVQLSGGLRVTNHLVNNGTLRLTGAAKLHVGGSFTNTGVLDIMTWSGTLPAGLVNTGTVLDRSLVRISSCRLSGLNFEATIQGYTGHNYQLQYRDDPAAGEWQDVSQAVAGAGAPLTLVHTNGVAGNARIYGVRVYP